MADIVPLRPRMDVSILFVGNDFEANGRPAAGMPLILDEDGSLHEGATAYFLQRMGREGATPGTMRVHGYAIKDWLQFLAGNRADWRDGSDALLSDWATDQAKGGIGEDRINEKLACVFAFYRTLQAIGVLHGVVEDPLAENVAGGGAGARFPIGAVLRVTEARSGTRRVSVHPRVHYRDPHAVRGRKRHTPDEAEVEAVLDHLLTASANDEFARARNFLCARVMAQMGLRREGTAHMTTTALERALSDVGIRTADLTPTSADERDRLLARGWRPWLRGLDAVAAMPDEQARIIDGLASLEGKHRRNLHVTVVEKGRKERVVPIPLRLMRAILTEWVWDHRKRFVEERRAQHPAYVPPPELWLSRKTGRAMTETAIANEVKRAFNALGIEASGHRLRAHYITELVRDLHDAARAAHGNMFDARTVLDQAAEIAGHANPATLKPYLTRAIKEDTFRLGEVVHVQNAEDAVLLREIASLLNVGDDRKAAMLRKMLAMTVDRVRGDG